MLLFVYRPVYLRKKSDLKCALILDKKITGTYVCGLMRTMAPVM